MNKDQILLGSKSIFSQFTDVCLAIPEQQFYSQPAGKWSIAENADHLLRAIKFTTLAYTLPKFMVRMVGGKPNRPSRTYEELVAKYKLKLEQGGKASGRYIPGKIAGKKFLLMRQWQKAYAKYLEAIDLKWKDEQFDHYIVSHPLLGKITVRELCYFTMYHTEHHLKIIQSRV
jgi:hypothetical protein